MAAVNIHLCVNRPPLVLADGNDPFQDKRGVELVVKWRKPFIGRMENI